MGTCYHVTDHHGHLLSPQFPRTQQFNKANANEEHWGDMASPNIAEPKRFLPPAALSSTIKGIFWKRLASRPQHHRPTNPAEQLPRVKARSAPVAKGMGRKTTPRRRINSWEPSRLVPALGCTSTACACEVAFPSPHNEIKVWLEYKCPSRMVVQIILFLSNPQKNLFFWTNVVVGKKHNLDLKARLFSFKPRRG